jgi:Domain of unknown function (DUF4347)
MVFYLWILHISLDRDRITQKGGDWELEIQTGKIKTPLALKPEVLATYSHILALFKVNEE